MLVHPAIRHDMTDLEILVACHAYYESLKGDSGRRIGPLVGYAARYDGEHQYVGEHYINFAMVEQWPHIIAAHLVPRMKLLLQAHGLLGMLTFCGAPEGGKVLATHLGAETKNRSIYPEKILDEHGTGHSRSKTHMSFKRARHALYPGERVSIVEDVCNNFSTAHQFAEEIIDHHAEPVVIQCIWNRSSPTRKEIIVRGRTIPVVSLIERPILEYRQDDPLVSQDVEHGHVCWRPKAAWDTLMGVNHRS